MPFPREAESRRKSVIIHDYKIIYSELVFHSHGVDAVILSAA